MKTWAPLIFPVAGFFLLVLLFAVCPDAGRWAASESFKYMPYVLFGIGFLLGGIFSQTRVSFLCLLFVFVTFMTHYSFFGSGEAAKGSTIILLSSISIPPLAAAFYWISESGLWSARTGLRGLVVLFVMVVIGVVPLIPEINEAVVHTHVAFFRPLSDYIGVPLAGLIFFVLSAPFLGFRKAHESPFLGKLLGIAVLFSFGAFSYPGEKYGASAEGILLVFMTGCGATLILAILEGSWRSANIDELTELPGRRMLKYHMANLGPLYAIGVLDIDHFKKINDKYGHDTGDQVLRFIAVHLNNNRAGKAYRYGGEEFVIVCEDEDFDETVEALELLRRSISGRKFWIRSKTRPKKKPGNGNLSGKPARDTGESITVTVSIGVARKSGKHNSPQEVLEAADKALYKAKKEGRNMVKVVNT